MIRAIAAGVMLVLLAAASPAVAQSWEVSGLAASMPSTDLDQRAPQLDELDIAGGFTWGLQGARLLTTHWGAEAMWTEQASALQIGTSAGRADLFDMKVRQLLGHAVYQFRRPDAPLQPFAFGGLGATFFSADDLEGETKLAFDVGGGVKYFATPAFGVRGHVRYTPTRLDDEDAGTFCDPFGFCQASLRQTEIAVGAVLRF